MQPRSPSPPDLPWSRWPASARSDAQDNRSRSGAAEHAVDVVLGGVAAVVGELRAVEEAAVVLNFGLEHNRRELLDAVPDRQQPGDVLLDELQRLKHMANALAGEILEIAGFENLHDPVLNVVGKPLLMAALGRRRQRVGGLVDLFGRLQDRLRRLLGAA